MTKYTLLGLMSGSSLDGLDCALVSFEFADIAVRHWEILFAETIQLPDHFVSLLTTLSSADEQQIHQAHTSLGQWLGEQCQALLSKYDATPDFIASHGHTVRHHPESGVTLQIGDPEPIAQLTGVPVIYDIRAADVAAGGQGAPLAPVVEKYCFPGHVYYLNLGGIANLSYHTADSIRAWDICPCNQVLNYVARMTGRSYDEGGQGAAQGQVIPKLLVELQQFIDLPLSEPYSLDNQWIKEHFFPLLNDVSPFDALRTSVEYIGLSITRQVESLSAMGEASMLISGGGAYNSFLIDRVQALMPDRTTLVVPDAEIIDYKEAVLVALCGLLRVVNKPNALASVTGASHDTINGVICHPHNAVNG